MPKFMTPFTVKQPLDEEMLSLLPAEQARIREMIREGVLLHIFVAADLSAGWIVFGVDSAEAALRLMDSLPMRRHMSVSVVELLD